MIALVEWLFFPVSYSFPSVELYTHAPFPHDCDVPLSSVGRIYIQTPNDTSIHFEISHLASLANDMLADLPWTEVLNVPAEFVLVSCAFYTPHEKTMPWIASGSRMKYLQHEWHTTCGREPLTPFVGDP